MSNESTNPTPVATDTCVGCGTALYFDNDREVYLPVGDPDAIFCGEGTDSHEPADMPGENAPEAPSCARCGRPVGNLPNGNARPYNLSDSGDPVCAEPGACKRAIYAGAKPLPRPEPEPEPEGVTPDDFTTAGYADAGDESARETINDRHEAGDHRLCAAPCLPGEFTRGHQDGSGDAIERMPRRDFVNDLPPNIEYARGYIVGFENPTTACPDHPDHDGFAIGYVEFCVNNDYDPCNIASAALYHRHLVANGNIATAHRPHVFIGQHERYKGSWKECAYCPAMYRPDIGEAPPDGPCEGARD